MARRRKERVRITRVDHPATAAATRSTFDELIVEEPMTIQLDGTVVATTMRTPGHDFELAAGFCFAEGLLGGASVTGVRYCADGSAVDTEFNVVTVETGGRAPEPSPRLGTVSSSCGWCGSEQLDDMCAGLEPLPVGGPIAYDVLASVSTAMADSSRLFAATGAVHSAAAFDHTGTLRVVREDVGRHNAVDKVVGSMVLGLSGSLPATGLGLFVSGRASVEMVQKAWAAGFSTLLAVSAPTALAVEAARRAGLVLVGFVRDDGFNVYSPARPS